MASVCAGVVVERAAVVAHVEADHVVVAAESHGLVEGVVDQVVRAAVAHAVEPHAGAVVGDDEPVVVDVVVVRDVVAGRERLEVAALQRDAALAEVVHVAPLHAAVRAARDLHAPGRRVAEHGRKDFRPYGVIEPDGCGAGVLEHEPVKCDVCHVARVDEPWGGGKANGL